MIDLCQQTMEQGLLHERDSVWFDRWRFEAAEAQHQIRLVEAHKGLVVEGHAMNIEEDSDSRPADHCLVSAAVEIERRLGELEKDNRELRQVTDSLQSAVKRLETQVQYLLKNDRPQVTEPITNPALTAQNNDDEDEDEIDLFGSDEGEDEAVEQLKEERRKEYEKRKEKKPAVIAKSNVVLDVKPWDDETDMKVVEKSVRSIVKDGLVWGASKLVPVGYGIMKLQITCVVEDEKISIEDLSEDITTQFEDNIQSVDVAAFNKI